MNPLHYFAIFCGLVMIGNLVCGLVMGSAWSMVGAAVSLLCGAVAYSLAKEIS